MMLPSLAPEASASADFATAAYKPYQNKSLHPAPKIWKWCRGPESNRYDCHQSRDFKSRASASFATPAILLGAGDGNRTHVASLEGWNSTIELHPQILLELARRIELPTC